MKKGDVTSPGQAETVGHLQAILFVDAVASSLRMNLDEVATIQALHEQLAWIADEVSRHSGYVWGRTGDGLLCTFDSAVSATECALSLQRQSLADASRSDHIAFRCGVHVGDVVRVGQDLFGNSINVAARLEHLAPPLGICLSRAVYDLVHHRLSTRFEPLGLQKLKNIPQPVEVFALRPGTIQSGERPSPIVNSGPQGESPLPYPLDEAATGVPCIAVLPFRTLADPGTERAIADGIVCDIIGRLTRFRRLDVIARASTFTLRGCNSTPREIGQRFLAHYLVHGDIGLNRGRLRMAVELIDTTTEKIVWGRTFDEDFGNVFDVQDRLSEEIVLSLMVEVDRNERHRMHARGPESLDAYSLCLRGEDELLSLKKQSCEAAKALFERAMRYCPDYARARASIARTHGFMWKYRWSEDRDRELELAREAAIEAVSMDYNDPRAHSEMGWVSLYRREHDRAIEAYGTALRLNPSDSDIIADYADALKHNGVPGEAVPLFERAIRLNPLHADIYLKDLAHTHFVLRDFDNAIATVHRMRRPGISRRVLAASYALAGRMEDAKREAAIIRQENPSFSPEAWVTMVPDRRAEYTELFLEGMKRAGL